MTENTEDNPDDNLEQNPDGENLPEDGSVEEQQQHKRHRHRRRVRKRIRIKKKSGGRRKLKKYGERLIWLIAIAGFIFALVKFMQEMEIQDESMKKKKKSTSYEQRMEQCVPVPEKSVAC